MKSSRAHELERECLRRNIFSLLMASLLSGSAFAFDEDGFRTGMSLPEVKQHLPKNLLLDNKPFRLSSGTEFYFVSSKSRKNSPIPPIREFTFCNGLLTGFTKESSNAQDYPSLMRSLLERYGQPIKIETTDKALTTDDRERQLAIGVTWQPQPDQIYLGFLPSMPATKGHRRKLELVTLTYYTPSADCHNEDLPKSNRALPVPFGELSSTGILKPATHSGRANG